MFSSITPTHYFIAGAVIFVLGLIGMQYLDAKQVGAYDEFATCIAESDATFYGAFWCPHCQDQKAMFGGSAELLPYIECSLPNGREQTTECIDADIKSYPTWEFADGSRLQGTLTFAQLAEKTNCTAPTK